MIQRIGDRYEFDRATVIGRGGMGTVYRGIDTRTGEAVAIKQLKPDMVADNPDFVERFAREADALRRLNHPNIVTVLATLQEDDAHYLVMEFVAGGTLWDEMQARSPLPIARVLQIALDLSDALTRAHRQKIIHRDLKPANVLIAQDGTPRLTDFGVAQLQDKTRVTRTGAVVGTLNYLSPEALNGDPTDERTDIWAFGVMLYEMLAGKSPFPEENTTALITAILTKSTPDVRQARPDVPQALATLVGQMLVKDPNKRIDSIRKVGSALEDILRGADSDVGLPAQIKQDLIDHSGRFDTPTPTDNPATHISTTPAKPFVTIVKSDTGEEYVMMPKRFALSLRYALVVPVLMVIGIVAVVIILTRPPDAPTQPSATPTQNRPLVDALIDNLPPMPTIGATEYPVWVALSGTGDGIAPEVRLMNTLRATFETDLPYSNIRIVGGATRLMMNDNADQPSALALGAVSALRTLAPALVVRIEEQADGLHVFINVGELSRFPHNQFQRNQLERLINVEIRVQNTAEVAPYVVGALAMLHSADGDLFELMRTMTMLSQLPKSNAQVQSAGISAQVYAFLADFITNPASALRAIDAALDRDGGNALLFMYRGLLHIRQLNFESANSDLTSAVRIGPNRWTLPIFAVSLFQGDIQLFEILVEERPDDWFASYLLADTYYGRNDLPKAQEAVMQALANTPQMNAAHLLAFSIAIRQGRLADAGRLLDELVRLYPDPGLSYAMLNATFGELFAVSALVSSAFANLVIGQYERVLVNTETLLSFVQNPQDFIRELNPAIVLPTPLPPPIDVPEGMSLAGQYGDLPYFYAGDIFLARGIAFCALGRLDEALNAYNIGLAIDVDNPMLHLLRAEIYLLQNQLQQATADLQAARGLSAEFDAFIENAVTEQEGCQTFFAAFVFLGMESE